MSEIIGIGLGTTNSCVSTMDSDECKVIVNPEENYTTPSVVAYRDGGRTAGDAARRQVVINKNTTSSIKRLMGTNGKVELEGKQYTPQKVGAVILQHLESYAEDYLGEKTEKVVITIPAHFNDPQHQTTKNAGKIAGLEVERIINESTAAALAYGIDKTGREQRVLVHDLGGDTLDVPILEFVDGTFEVLSIDGGTGLGGDDFDNVIVNWMVNIFKKENGIGPRKDTMAMQCLEEARRKTKKDLSGVVQTQISPPSISAEANRPLYFGAVLTRAKFGEMAESLTERAMKPVRNALCDAGLTENDIYQVLLVGGSTRIPAVQGAVKSVLDKEPNKSVDPGEAVAMGAAIQGDVIAGDVKDVLLLDVTSLSLGIETTGDVITVLIPHNTTIPTSRSQVLSTVADDQPAVDIRALQGERSMANDNKELGMFKLDGIAPVRRDVPRIEVAFDIGVNGIVHVSAKGKGTDKEQSITIQNISGLSDEGIDRMACETEGRKAEDEKRKEEIDLRDRIEDFIARIDSILTNNDDKINTKQKEETQKLHDDLQKSLGGNDMDAVEEKLGTLEKAVQTANVQIYQQWSVDLDAGVGTNNANNDNNVVSAEFEEEK